MRGLASPLIFYRETSKTALLCTRQQGGVRALKSPNRTVPHPLAGRESVSLRETLPYPQIGFAAHCGLRPAVDQLFCQIDARPAPCWPVAGNIHSRAESKSPGKFRFLEPFRGFQIILRLFELDSGKLFSGCNRYSFPVWRSVFSTPSIVCF